MFYCDPCGNSRSWPTEAWLPKSIGRCECCGVIRPCNDIPSGLLPRPKKPKPKKVPNANLR